MASILSDYLTYYRGLKNPGFAVLVSGAWGCGKTFQVKRALPYGEYNYVSLYGLKDLPELQEAVFAVANPAKSSVRNLLKLPKGVSIMGNSVGETFTTIANYVRESVDPKKIYIFDDLERCLLPLESILGFINRYVEHHECRVIVIADEEKLRGRSAERNGHEFSSVKEKLFGHTIVVQPETDAALNVFIEEVEYKNIREFLFDKSPELIKFFGKMEGRSLRVLRTAIMDLVRLFEALDETLMKTDFVQSVTLPVYFCLKVAAVEGTLVKNDVLQWRKKGYWGAVASLDPELGGKDKIEPPKMDELQTKLDLNFDKCGFEVELLASMIFDGRFEVSDIQNSLNTRRKALKGEDRRPWQIAMNFDSEEDASVHSAIDQMEKDILHRFQMPKGETLHVFSLLLMFAHRGALSKSLSEVTAMCEGYITDLAALNAFAEYSSGFRSENERSYGGYGYWVEEMNSDQHRAFSTLHTKIKNATRENQICKALEHFPQVLRNMHDDVDAFHDKLCKWNEKPGCTSELPFLERTDANEFVQAFLAAPNKNFHTIYYTIKERSEKAQRTEGWEGELKWWKDVLSKLHSEIERRSPLQRIRLLRAVPGLA